MRLLIADNDETSRLRLRYAMERIGFEVQEACDGDETIRYLEDQRGPRIAVLNGLMSDDEVLAACRRLRQSGSARYVYLLVLSDPDSTEHKIACLEAGADDCITKPYNLDELRGRLRAGERWLRLHDEHMKKAMPHTPGDAAPVEWTTMTNLRLIPGTVKTRRTVRAGFCVITSVSSNLP